MPIDLNADLGELPGSAGEAIDAALLGLVTSANVATGGHAGDDESMHRVCRIARAHHVSIGAHLSFEDRPGFGRRVPDAIDARLVHSLRQQLDRLASAAAAAGTSIAYVKPHGALYNLALDDSACARAVVSAIGDERLPVLTIRGSALDSAAREAGLATYGEFFADRGYLPSGRLVPRGSAGDMVTDRVAERVIHAIRTGEVVACDGSSVNVQFDSICLHGDTMNAVAHAERIRDAVREAGIALRGLCQ